MMSGLDWNDIRVFLALFRARSVRKSLAIQSRRKSRGQTILPDFTDFAYASPDYLREHWFEGDQTSATWLGIGGSEPSDSWIKNTPFPQPASRHNFSDLMDRAQAAVAGLGMTALTLLLR